MQFALRYPDRVRRLVVADIAPRAYPPCHQHLLEALLRLPLDSFPTRTRIEEALADEIPDRAMRQFLLKNAVRDEAGRFRWRNGLQEIYNNYQHLRAAVAGEVFAKEALFLRGERSDFLCEPDLEHIRTLFPQARLDVIPRANHLLHVENPDAFLDAVRGFLTASEPPSAEL